MATAKKQSSTQKHVENEIVARYGHLADQDSFQFALHVATVAVLVAVMVTMVSQTVNVSRPTGRVAGTTSTSTLYR